ncbi:MAG: plasminogen-binding N-terminal domain-containing protein [Campylobacterota bacterium]|nr:plasminogen-binding N-terminal domain-containing protein [Campylobacterota bacterium]
MHKIARIALLISFFGTPLFAGFFPQTVHTSIKSVDGKNITLKQNFPINGMSGAVIHNYGDGLSAITSRITQTSTKGEAILLDADVIDHEALPSIKTSVSPKDRVIGGYLYNNILLLAPDANTYAKITSSRQKKWIHPDLFAVYLSVLGDNRPTKENLASFAKKFQIGLIYIVRKNRAILLDPISGTIVGEKKMSGLPKKGQFPFYMRIKAPESGWFGGSSDTTGNYYNTMQSI